MRYAAILLPSLLAVSAVAVIGGCRHGEHDRRVGVHDHAGHAHAAHNGGHQGSSEIENAMSQLAPADRASAQRQAICPVTDEPLGSMGAPIKVRNVNGRDVFVCCAGCEDALREEPTKYLAKLPQ